MVTVCNLPLPVKIEAELYFLKFHTLPERILDVTLLQVAKS